MSMVYNKGFSTFQISMIMVIMLNEITFILFIMCESVFIQHGIDTISIEYNDKDICEKSGERIEKIIKREHPAHGIGCKYICIEK